MTEEKTATSESQWSPDHQWWWDGQKWIPAVDAPADPAISNGQQWSPDHQWWWDGQKWISAIDAAADAANYRRPVLRERTEREPKKQQAIDEGLVAHIAPDRPDGLIDHISSRLNKVLTPTLAPKRDHLHHAARICWRGSRLH